MVPLSRARPAGREVARAAATATVVAHALACSGELQFAVPMTGDFSRLLITSHGHSRCSSSSDPLPVRPAGISWTSYNPAAPRPALPHADPLLCAESSSQKPLHQLATGPAEQLSRAAGLPGANHGAIRGSRSGCRNGGIQSV